MNWIIMLAWLHAAFLVGISIVVFIDYIFDRRIIHIAVVAGSHCGMTTLLCYGLSQGDRPLWFTTVALVCFAASDYAVLNIYSHKVTARHRDVKGAR